MRPRTSPLSPPIAPDLSEEEALVSQGFRRIVGLDEAGRGSWAGPLVAAAVRLPVASHELLRHLEGVRDSKELTPSRRTEAYARILESAIDVGIGVVSPGTIDHVGLTRAGEMAMLWAVDDMVGSPDCLLIDAFYLRGCRLHQRAIIRGDAISLSIASASIIAKVTRDRLMMAADSSFPGYGFHDHKGYGTPFHRKALDEHGPCSYHRQSFEPIRLCWGLPL